MRINDSQLSAFILDQGLIKKEALEKAQAEVKKSGKTLHEVILSRKLLSEERINQLEAYIRGIPFVNLEKAVIDPGTLNIIPEPTARKNNVIAYNIRGKELEMAMLDPDDIQTIEFIKKKSNH